MNSVQSFSFSSFSAVHSFSASKSLDSSVMNHPVAATAATSSHQDVSPAMLANSDIVALAAKWLAREVRAGDDRFVAETSAFGLEYQGWPQPANTKNKKSFVCYFEDLRPLRIALSDRTFESFIHRIQNETSASAESIVFAIVYLQQLTRANPFFFIYSRNVSRLLTTSVAAASRFQDAAPCSDQAWVNLRGLDRCDLEVTLEFFSLQQNQFREMLGDSFRALSMEAAMDCIHSLQAEFSAPSKELFPAPVMTLSDPTITFSVSPKADLLASSPRMSPKMDASFPDFSFSKMSPTFQFQLSPKMDGMDPFCLGGAADSFTFELDDSAAIDMSLDGGEVYDYVAELSESPALVNSSTPAFDAFHSSLLLSASTQKVVSISDVNVPSMPQHVAQALLEEDDGDDDAIWTDCSALPTSQPKFVYHAPPPRPLPIPEFTSIYSVDDFRKLPSAQRALLPSSAFAAASHAHYRPLPIPAVSSIAQHSWQFARQIAASQHAQQKRVEILPQTADGFFPSLL